MKPEAKKTEKNEVRKFCRFLLSSLEETDDFDEALEATQIALSMEAGVSFGMIGDEWHGPVAPGPGWHEVGKGPHGGKIWKQGKETPITVEPETPSPSLKDVIKPDAALSISRPKKPIPLETVYGTEPPGDGWTYAGPMKWTRPSTAMQPRIAVIGGGPGGMFTTYILNQRLPDANVTLFEASNRLGGKILTEQFSDGTHFEAGVAELYQYLGPGGKDPLRSLIEDDLGLPTVNMSGGGVVLRNKVLRNHDDLEREFGSSARLAVEVFHELMVELMPLKQFATRWQPDNAHPWANKPFRDCIREVMEGEDAAIEYVEASVASDLATESHTCNGLNGIKNVLMDNDDYLQLYHIIGGNERLPIALASRLDAEVRLNTRVLSIAKEGSSYRVTFQHGGVEDYEDFDYVIVAMPNHWLTQLKWPSPLLREAIHSIIAHYDLPAHYYRVTLLFDMPWWDRFDFPGDFWMMDMFNGCCCYNESKRWRSTKGHILSFLLAGQDALLMCAANQGTNEIARHLIDQLPPDWRAEAKEHLLDARVDSYAGSINAQPGSWPVEELRGEHHPEPKEHPGFFIAGDYFFDSTLNAALISASTAVELLVEESGLKSATGTPAVEQLTPDKKGL